MTTKEATILVPCTEPACKDYDTGHEMTEYSIACNEGFIHETELTDENGPLWVTVSKYGDEPWRVDFELSTNDMTCDPDRAKQIADSIWDAAAKCRDLNATTR